MRLTLNPLGLFLGLLLLLPSVYPSRYFQDNDDEDLYTAGSGDGTDEEVFNGGWSSSTTNVALNLTTPRPGEDARLSEYMGSSISPPYHGHAVSRYPDPYPLVSIPRMTTTTTTSTMSPLSSSRIDQRYPRPKWPINYETGYNNNLESFTGERPLIKVYPTSQIIYTTQEVVIRCRDESYHRLPVAWSRMDGRPISLGATDRSGRLVIPNIALSDAGDYKCAPIDTSYSYTYMNTSKVIVYPIETLRSQQIIAEPDTFRCHSGQRACPGTTRCIPEAYFCDGEPDCISARDEENCETCKLYQFRCRSGQCIDSARRCDSLADCRDGSDEVDCDNGSENEKGNVVPLQLSIVPPHLDVERGAFVQFACASSNPNARLVWVFEQGQLPLGATVIAGTLTIRNAQETDQGTYICMATDMYGTKAEAQARLTVRRAQSMVNANIVPRYIEVQEGGNVVLTCNSSSLDANYVWFFNRGDLPMGAKAMRNQLRIYPADQRHSGNYQCAVRTPYGTGEAVALVTINPVNSERRPAMMVQPSHSEVPIGGTARFLCNATDPRPNQIIWTFRRAGLPPGATQSRELLTISPVTEIHYGEYICIVSNSFGRNQQTVELQRPGGSTHDTPVQPSPSYGPSIDIQPAGGASVNIGEYARFECRSNEVEPNDLKWMSLSGDLPEGASSENGILIIPVVSESHYGIYACEASASFGKTRKSIELRRPSLSPNISPPYRPITGPIDATIEPQQQTIVQGNSGILRCLVTGVPSSSIIWSKVNGALTERHRIDGEIMRIENAVISDRGLYVCKVESPPGTVVAQGSAIVEIEPREPPIVEIYPSVTQSIQIGGSALFQCRLTAGIPEPKIHWTRADNSPLTPNTETVEGGVIRFLRVTGSEEGIYKCTAENIAGRVEYEVTLRIERSEVPVIPGPDPIRPPYSDPRPSYQPRPSSSDIGIKISPRSPLYIKEGEPLMLDCITEGSADAQVIWMSTQQGKYITSTATRRNVYQKYDTTADDSGEYRCIAHSAAGTAEERIQVMVESNGRYPQPSPQPYESVRNVTLTVGGSTELKCHASGPGIPSASMSWTRESGQLPSNAYQRDGTLYIDKINEENSGTYLCTGRGPRGEIVAVQKVLLNIQSQLTLQLDPISQVVVEGQQVILNCIAAGAGSDPVTFSWTREGAAMSPRTRIIGGQLVFLEISPSDTGSYICKGVSSIGQARAVAHIKVGSSGGQQSPVYPPRPSPSPSPVQPQYPPNYETRPPQGKREIVDQRSAKTLSCDFRRIPGHVIQWEFNNVRTLPPNAVVYGNTVVLSNIDKGNEGRYICNAHLPGSERPIDRDFIDLIVREPETCTAYEFRCYDTTCIERERRCDGKQDCFDGSDEQYCPDSRQPYPRPPDTRSRNPTEQRANYPYPQQSYPVYDPRYPPQQPIKVSVKIEPNKMMVNAGDDFELRCNADGSDYRYEWFKDVQPIKNSENIEIHHNVLTIKNTKSENGGVYTCRARNRYAYGTAEHVVMIQRASNQNEIRIVEADLGSSVGLDCPRPVPGALYTWTRPDQPLPTDSEIMNERLIVKNVKSNYAGQYHCSAKGPLGSATSSITLVVKKVIPRFRREYNSHIKLAALTESEKSFDIELAIKPEFGEGLILYSGSQVDPTTRQRNFISLTLNRGFLEFRIQSGTATLAKIRASKPATLGDWTKVVIQKDGPNIAMIINDSSEPPVTLTGENLDLKLSEPLYIGGVPSIGEVNYDIGVFEGFIGCMSILKVKGRSIIMAEGELYGVSSCSVCSTEVCSGHGACHEDATVTSGFQCICHPGFSGRNCSANVDACKEGSCGVGRCINQAEGGYDCYCPFGRAGPHCEREITIRKPSFNGGNAFAALPAVKLSSEPSSSSSSFNPNMQVLMKVKPNLNKDGLIMYSGQDDSGSKDFIAVSIKGNVLEFAFDAGSGPAFIRSPPLEKSDKFLTFEVKTDQNRGMLIFDGKEYQEKAPGPARMLSLKTPTYVGGFDQSKLKLPRTLNISHGFDGCIGHVEINAEEIDFASQVMDAANVDDCGSHESCTETDQHCQNGGTCQVESCVCPAEFTGHRCETPINGSPNEPMTTKSSSQPPSTTSPSELETTSAPSSTEMSSE